MRKRIVLAVVIAVVLLGLVGWNSYAERRRGQWEYKVVNTETMDFDINALGTQGWELVIAREQANHSVIFYFKRPK